MNKIEKLILVLSIYVIVELYISIIIDYSNNVLFITESIDFIICLIFLSNFFYHLYKTEEKGKYLRENWIDFVSSIPFIEILRIGRFVRILKVFRLLRTGKVFYKYINQNKSLSTLQLVLFCTGLLIIISTISVYTIEHPVNPQFKTIYDSLWWSVTTTITLGYGDIVPITSEGKMFSVAIIGAGIVLIGTFTGFVTDYFVDDDGIKTQLNRIEEKLDRLLEQK